MTDLPTSTEALPADRDVLEAIHDDLAAEEATLKCVLETLNNTERTEIENVWAARAAMARSLDRLDKIVDRLERYQLASASEEPVPA